MYPVFSTPIPLTGRYTYDRQQLIAAWAQLHRFDNEPLPDANTLTRWRQQTPAAFAGLADDTGELSVRLLDAWCLFHAGDFGGAFAAGRALGPIGYSLAHIAACAYADAANLPQEQAKHLFQDCAQHSADAARLMPAHVNSTFYYGLHLGRYSETISLLKAAAENIAPKFVQALTDTLRMDSQHVLATLGFGAYHASVVGSVGSLVAKLTYGASKEKACEYFDTALRLAPELPGVYLEYGKALLALKDKKLKPEARRYFEIGAQKTPRDAMEELDIRFCQKGLEDCGQ